MRIGLIATGIWGSVHLELAKEIARCGHDVAVYTEDNRAPSGMRFTHIKEDGLHFWVIHGFRRNPWTWFADRLFKFWLGRRFFTTLVAIWRFVRVNRDRDVFVVESDWLGFFVAIVGMFERFRWVVGIHDTDYLDAPIRYAGRPSSRWRTSVQRWVLRRADAVRANSYVTRDALIAGGCPAQKIATIPLHYLPARMLPPADVPIDDFRADCRRSVRVRLGVPDNAELMMTMCRLATVKRLELAVDTLAEALPTRPDLWLALCGGDRRLPGTGSYAEVLRARAQRLGVAHRLVIAGEVEPRKVKEYLGAADLHLAPSWVDTFNYGVVEAALVGTPSLVSAAVGAGPWVAECGGARIIEDACGASWAKAVGDVLGSGVAERVPESCRIGLIHDLAPEAIAQQVLACWAGKR